ncbi:MAG: DEAD/DEAH box helicase family protein [Alloprevotella sp.]|nr:DEAD/DEAH box helicase family protein [Alloprevotella sp.]
MKFKFKIQQYQTDAVEQTVSVFAGQPSKGADYYRRDLGDTRGRIVYEDDYVGYKNAKVELSDGQLFANIRAIQLENNIPQSKKLVKEDGLGACSLDIEMETGTGKTYVYIKTMFEMQKRYGWSKFIVVVPSIAIREGVYKSFTMLEDHFMEQYGKKARFFIYNSANLTQIDTFSTDASLNVMIINVQAFNSSFKEGARNKEARIIYSVRDDFQSRRPIDVIAANRPIIIMDEPQMMEGDATRRALKNFKPLFVLNYSATHKTSHNCIYALDAYDAYQQRLVKKIQVKGFTLQNLQGTAAYIYFDSIVLSKNKAPEVRLEIEVKGASSNSRRLMKFGVGDSLKDASQLAAYDGFTITDIDGATNSIQFMNGVAMRRGQAIGDVSEDQLQRIQIRETVKSHFEKELTLFKQGIKTLSLFFIDEVANYKSYDEQGEVVKGYLWKVFEEEYMRFLNENLNLFEEDYRKYLQRFTAEQVHGGYFSIDKKGHAINSEVRRGESFSTDISAYDLILKNKERLLSFDEPVRFIFSHSALREGWDNPNVFQICTLRHANSATAKRQEVGRGLRLCVDKDGNRMDAERLGEAVHDINKLTVIANENYSTFVDDLQKETREALRERPTKASLEHFMGKTFKLEDGNTHTIDDREASRIMVYLEDNEYIDDKGNIMPAYHEALATNTLAAMPEKLEAIEPQVQRLIQGIFDPSALAGMIEDGNETAEVVNEGLNDNAQRDEFKKLWEEINHRYVYTVHYDSDELIQKAVAAINKYLSVTELKYIVTTGEQLEDGTDFKDEIQKRTERLSKVSTSEVAYDLVGEIAKGATLTRRTVVSILKGIQEAKLLLFKNNPEEFIRNVIKIIKDEKATMIVDHISYNMTDQKFEADIFTAVKNRQPVNRAYAARKHILDYVFTDSKIERDFAKDLDDHNEVCVYAKLPRTFKIPTPVGDYAPDWAIAFYDNMGVKHIYFVAETKGSMETMQLKGAELSKRNCAEKLFNELKATNVRYKLVDTYEKLMNEMSEIE